MCEIIDLQLTIPSKCLSYSSHLSSSVTFRNVNILQTHRQSLVEHKRRMLRQTETKYRWQNLGYIPVCMSNRNHIIENIRAEATYRAHKQNRKILVCAMQQRTCTDECHDHMILLILRTMVTMDISRRRFCKKNKENGYWRKRCCGDNDMQRLYAF